MERGTEVTNFQSVDWILTQILEWYTSSYSFYSFGFLLLIVFIGLEHFDDTDGDLAHAYHSSHLTKHPGEIHFNENINWVANTTGGVNLLAVALHEIGHTLGISHSNVATSVMTSTIFNNKTKLDGDDIAAIRFLYGKRQLLSFPYP